MYILCYSSISSDKTCLSNSCACAENACLLDGSHAIDVPIVTEANGLIHHNDLFCHLFYTVTKSQGMAALVVSPKFNTVELAVASCSQLFLQSRQPETCRLRMSLPPRSRTSTVSSSTPSDGQCHSACPSMRKHGSPRTGIHYPCRVPQGPQRIASRHDYEGIIKMPGASGVLNKVY
jgi:hypothetical protein